ncbi:MAG: peptidylprolyl isomerase [Trichocoleus desertorum ATA4-8-CV12]|jgi:parvulin-like peptidyl-prolyl isomerase|nr:peptidylprolyl isomerase [Trichocoleus desertorum ATA4-8-CV12]
MSKPNPSFQPDSVRAISSKQLLNQEKITDRKPSASETVQITQQESANSSIKPSIPEFLPSGSQPPLNFELAEYAVLTAEFLKGLHRRGKLLPLLREATIERSLLEYANTFEIEITPHELQNAADTFRQQNDLTSTIEMDAWLAREHISIADFEDSLHRNLLMSKLRDYVTRGQITVRFDADSSRYDRAYIHQIIVPREDLAQTLYNQLSQQNSDFVQVARNYSIEKTVENQDDGTRLIFRCHLPLDSVESIFSAKTNDVVGPIPISSNFHLFQVERVEPAELDNFTVESIRTELFDSWLNEQFHDVRIDVQLLKLIP